MTKKILGHRKQIEFIITAIKQKNIPNAWLFFGSKGIGKALLAQKIAHLLASQPPIPQGPGPGPWGRG